MGTQPIRCALTCCTWAKTEQTPCSLITRITTAFLGCIALLLGILILNGIPGLYSLGSIGGGILVGIGSLMLLGSASLKCIVKKASNESHSKKTSLHKKQGGEQTTSRNHTSSGLSESFDAHTFPNSYLTKNLEAIHGSVAQMREAEKKKKYEGSQKELSDEQIIKNLHSQGYQGPIEEGSDGRCLFNSILPQITDDDIQKGLSSKYAQYFTGWEHLPKSSAQDDKLDRLRQMALAEEEDFLNSLQNYKTKNTEPFNAYQQDRIVELYKDMLQEVEGLDATAIRERLKTTLKPEAEINNQLLYCEHNFKKYKEQTSRKYNWAGTSELIAIGKILNKPVIAFGRDLYPSSVDEQGNVLPFYNSASVTCAHASAPIAVFQCNGGGHYRRLIPP